MGYYQNSSYRGAPQGRSGQSGGRSGEPPKLPAGYLSSGYYLPAADGGKEPNPDYILRFPKAIARDLKHPQANKSAQLRKFYDYCIRLRDMVRYQGLDFPSVRAELARLEPFVEYAQKRKRVTQLFTDFIRENVKAVQSDEDFRAFLKHFEALIAYLPKDQ